MLSRVSEQSWFLSLCKEEMREGRSRGRTRVGIMKNPTKRSCEDVTLTAKQSIYNQHKSVTSVLIFHLKRKYFDIYSVLNTYSKSSASPDLDSVQLFLALFPQGCTASWELRPHFFILIYINISAAVLLEQNERRREESGSTSLRGTLPYAECPFRIHF